MVVHKDAATEVLETLEQLTLKTNMRIAQMLVNAIPEIPTPCPQFFYMEDGELACLLKAFEAKFDKEKPPIAGENIGRKERNQC